MCSKGYKIIFNGSRCEIRKGGPERLVAKCIRTNGNVYYVKENTRRNFLLAQRNECRLCHKRLGDVNIDNMVNINPTHVVRYLPRIIKPAHDTMCKGCQMGK